MQLTAGELDRLGIPVDLVGLGDGMLGGRLKSPHEAKISLELMGELAAESRVGDDATEDGKGSFNSRVIKNHLFHVYRFGMRDFIICHSPLLTSIFMNKIQ